MNLFFDETTISGRYCNKEEGFYELYITKDYGPDMEEFSLIFRDIEQIRVFKQIVDLFYEKSQGKIDRGEFNG